MTDLRLLCFQLKIENDNFNCMIFIVTHQLHGNLFSIKLKNLRLISLKQTEFSTLFCDYLF